MCGRRAESGRHHVHLYDSLDQMVVIAAGLVEGTEAPTVVAVDANSSERLRRRVPGIRRFVDVDASTFHASHATQALVRGREVRADHPWCVINAITPATSRNWQSWLLYEAALNQLATEAATEMHCLLDRGAVPAAIEDELLRSHPYVGTPNGVELNASFLPPAETVARLVRKPLPAGPANVHLLDPVESSVMRRCLVELAKSVADAGSIAAFAVACTEILTNSIRHGRRPIDVRVWAGDDGITVSIRDAGAGPDLLEGLLPPTPNQIGGYGIWIARNWSDWLHIIHDATGCEVRLGLDSRRAAD